MHPSDYEERVSEMARRDSNPFWKAFYLSLSEHRQETQNRVNRLDVVGDDLQKARVELAFLDRFLTGEFFRDETDLLIQRKERDVEELHSVEKADDEPR